MRSQRLQVSKLCRQSCCTLLTNLPDPLQLTGTGFAGPMPLQSFKSYKNDLFGEEDGDVLAAETIPAAKPIEVSVPRPTTPSNRVQQQIALNQQKRLARLQVFCFWQ